MTLGRHLGSACATVAVAAVLLTGCTKSPNLKDIGTTTDDRQTDSCQDGAA